MHDYLSARGRRERSGISLVMPLPVPIPPSPEASKALLVAFEERGIEWHPGKLVHGLDPERSVALIADGSEMPYDLFLGVPVHRAPAVVEDAGLTVDGWIPVNPLTLETAFADVYAVGDVTSVGTPKAGVFAEGQAAVVAAGISARIRGETSSAQYDGHGMCYLEFGDDAVAIVDVTFTSGEMPQGALHGPSPELTAHKTEFGTSRIRRWFDREWTSAR
jgi:sulfide:quinone oxidoreductase